MINVVKGEGMAADRLMPNRLLIGADGIVYAK
jgi:hypothetical protein